MLAEHRIETGMLAQFDCLPTDYPTHIKELELIQEERIIEPSKSKWSSPIVLVKKNGSLRM